MKEEKRANRASCGRKRKHPPVEAERTNWFSPFLFTQIDAAAKQVGWQMSPAAIVDLLQKRDPVVFSRLTRQVVGRWIDRADGRPKWKAAVMVRLEAGNRPGGQPTRHGILVSPKNELVGNVYLP